MEADKSVWSVEVAVETAYWRSTVVFQFRLAFLVYRDSTLQNVAYAHQCNRETYIRCVLIRTVVQFCHIPGQILRYVLTSVARVLHCCCCFFILSCHYPSLKIVTVRWLQLTDPSTKPWVVSAIGKVTSQMGQLLESTRDVLEKHVSGVDVELRQVRKWTMGIFYNVLCLLLNRKRDL